MNLSRELRQNSVAFIADAESFVALAEPPADAVKSAVYLVTVVSLQTVMRLGFEPWLPEVYRGLDVYFPAEDWRLPAEPLAATSSAPAASLDRRRPIAENAEPLCPVCDYGFYWEAIGDPTLRCVTCEPPPSKRMAEDLWLAENERWLVCVSDNDRWVRAAFFHLAESERRQREAAAAKASVENQGF